MRQALLRRDHQIKQTSESGFINGLIGYAVGSRGFRGRLRLALLPGGRRGQPCSLRKQRQSRRRRPTHRLVVVLGELAQTTAGKWIAHPPTRCPNGHSLGPGEVLVGEIGV